MAKQGSKKLHLPHKYAASLKIQIAHKELEKKNGKAGGVITVTTPLHTLQNFTI